MRPTHILYAIIESPDPDKKPYWKECGGAYLNSDGSHRLVGTLGDK